MVRTIGVVLKLENCKQLRARLLIRSLYGLLSFFIAVEREACSFHLTLRKRARVILRVNSGTSDGVHSQRDSMTVVSFVT